MPEDWVEARVLGFKDGMNIVETIDGRRFYTHTTSRLGEYADTTSSILVDVNDLERIIEGKIRLAHSFKIDKPEHKIPLEDLRLSFMSEIPQEPDDNSLEKIVSFEPGERFVGRIIGVSTSESKAYIELLEGTSDRKLIWPFGDNNPYPVDVEVTGTIDLKFTNSYRVKPNSVVVYNLARFSPITFIALDEIDNKFVVVYEKGKKVILPYNEDLPGNEAIDSSPDYKPKEFVMGDKTYELVTLSPEYLDGVLKKNEYSPHLVLSDSYEDPLRPGKSRFGYFKFSPDLNQADPQQFLEKLFQKALERGLKV